MKKTVSVLIFISSFIMLISACNTERGAMPPTTIHNQVDPEFLEDRGYMNRYYGLDDWRRHYVNHDNGTLPYAYRDLPYRNYNATDERNRLSIVKSNIAAQIERSVEKITGVQDARVFIRGKNILITLDTTKAKHAAAVKEQVIMQAKRIAPDCNITMRF